MYNLEKLEINSTITDVGTEKEHGKKGVTVLFASTLTDTSYFFCSRLRFCGNNNVPVGF